MEYETTLPVAIVTSVLLLILGWSMLFATRGWLSLIAEYSERPHRLLMPGLAMVAYGLVVVFNHNVWSGGWAVVITVTGWLIFLKGLTFLLNPGIVKIHERFPQSFVKMAMRVGGVVLILLGLMLILIFTGRT